ncbi:MAG: protease modulator HflC [Lentilitoribacter sp.]|mmetsp:Transcript_29724/g.38877  ORF Transcript_29724/g.38877 Transcript_29724/m.38877 type:complete len:303 (+) Transcript_29724:381-1289(+)|eukprot:CAMPEP_0195257496 /NCGR_PEP_ID=MMETSP0706-20130129/6851_1 /TAXON_ID=33640 /ORGANISM="Asterionellopsis glacialis, Strain CCMP134" /LENGTH=302 /DNA_ID=CAMNT_0040310711 /DNA_START=151 /DNA_END=1059 /DNA_ORIENTATION=+
MSSRLPFFLGIFAVIAVIVYSSLFVVNEREQAIVIRFGEIQSVKTEPGLYFKVPFTFADFDSVQYVEDRTLRFDLENIRVQVSGGKFYEVDAFVLYKISDAQTFRQTVSGDVIAVESRLRTRLNSALRTVYGLRGFEAALSAERASMMREVRDQLRPEAQALGVTIDDVRIRRTDLTQEVSQQTYERMKAERLAEAEAIRARGIEAGQRLRSIADRQIVEFVSAAERDAQIIRGEGDAERNAIFADAFNRDQDFFEFYRSMEAYGKAIEADGTTMVLSPDSEFFKFFKNSEGVPPAAPASGN